MTINSTTRKAGPFVGNGTVSAFPFGFKVFQASDLFVVRLNVSAAVEQTLVLNSDYSVTLNPDQNSNPGGVVTLSSALASGYTLTLTSDVPDTQPTDLTNQGGFYPEVINDALDRATIQIQQLQEEIDRTITAPISTPAGTDLTFPLPDANKFIGWNSTATGLQNLDGSTLASIVAFATAYADTFNGDGVASTFALSYPPATVRNLDVSINGVTQVPVIDYDINGQALNFTTPPPLGSVVLAKYWQALPNSSGAAQDFTLTPNGYTTAVDVQEGFDDLGSSAGTSKVGFLQAGTGAQARSAQDKLRDIISVKDFGAVGDGVTDDTAAIQAAINACAGTTVGTAKTVYFPAGDYYISAPIEIPNYTSIIGDGPSKSRINLQGKPYTSHIFTNADPVTWGWLSIQDFGFRGGSYGLLNASASQESWTLSNVSFEIQTIAGIRSEVSFQVNNIRNVSFYYCAHGLIVHSGFMNMNNFDSCDFAGIANQAILAVGGSTEVNNFTGCRFEAGGVLGRSTVYLANARNTNFYGCYIENTHDTFLDQSSSSGTTFHGCHFTGAIAGSTPYKFVSDSVVEFGANTWGAVSDGPAKMMVLGDNQNKLGKNNKIIVHNSKQKSHLVGTSTALSIGSNLVDTVKFSRIFTSSTLTDNAALFGEIKVLVQQVKTGGFVEQLMVTIPVFAVIIAAGAFSVTFGTTVTNRDTTGATVTVTPSMVSETLRLTIAGVSASLDNGFVTWKFESFSGANPTFNPITIDFA